MSKSYYITQEENEIIDLTKWYQEANPDKTIRSIKCNASFIESPDMDIGIVYLAKIQNSYKSLSEFIIPISAGGIVSDTGFIFEAFQVIASAGTRIRFFANYL